MTVDPRSDGRRGVGALLRDLAESSAGLIRAEARLVRLELGDAARLAGRGTAFVALGGVLLLLGALAALTGLILLIGDQWLPHDRYWLGALLVALIAGGIAAWLASRARTALSPSALLPRETVSTLKEDGEWLKQRLT
ncbi:MAG TPA: phage holin family protein [Gemmatimonadaceae bacterium]